MFKAMRSQLGSVVIALMLGCLPVQMMVCEFASAQTISDRKAEADRLFEKGNQLSNVRKYQEALPALEQSLKIYREIKDRNGEEQTIVTLGVAYNYLGEYAKANEYLRQLEMMSKPVSSQTVSERQAEANRLLNEGSQLYKDSKYQEALQAWEQALQIYRDIKNINGEGAILYNLGLIYYSIEQYKKALEYYQPALVIYKQVNSSKWERNLLKDLLLNIGVSYSSLGEHKKAIEFYEQSLIIAMQENDLKTRLLLLTNIGSASIFSAQYQKAIEYYQ
ncbi:tetratricopeptide repeat protein [Pseudanabaena sp. UWO310]|uniref:tetratricopeptide repeat protein n=1 Tax=Pseudanabaena sp. UWO310 TaxID=2480795 RepID=UPI001158084D|nr:tetratricopeptide repeat protein [Pseudanabaena sp. UWO310]TYQ31161.1 tetratricopeptide repeat protein [Pseudanabaena sp. UWO310]